MKTMFVLGAGASQTAGAPLMGDFLDRAHDLLRAKVGGVVDAQDQFMDVFKAISELQGVHSKAFLDLNNIEIVFGAIEMGLLLKRLGDRDGESIATLRDSLITLIYKTLEFGIQFPVRNRKIQPPKPYDGFMTTLQGIEKSQPRQDPHQFTFLTFNYDLCLDYSLYHFGRAFDYCLDGVNRPSTSPLLKLHGSINWGLSHNGKIVPFQVGDARFDLFDDDSKYVFFNLGTNLESRTFEDKPLSGPPVIVPPSWNKNSYHGQLSNVWSRAAHEFAAAENIFIIGYSLPETDSFFRYLYALGSESSTRLRNFVVINKDSSGSVEGRFKELVGRGIESRFKYIAKTFINSLSDINDILINP